MREILQKLADLTEDPFDQVLVDTDPNRLLEQVYNQFNELRQANYDYDAFKTELEDCEDQISDLESDNNHLENRIEELKEEIQTLEETILHLEQDKEVFQNCIDKLEKDKEWIPLRERSPKLGIKVLLKDRHTDVIGVLCTDEHRSRFYWDTNVGIQNYFNFEAWYPIPNQGEE